MNDETDIHAATDYLVPSGTEVEVPGSSAAYELGALAGRLVLLVLRVEGAIEQESLHVSVWGAADGEDWGADALFWFPQIFSTGLKPAALNLVELPEIKYLQARWDVKRWGRGVPRPYYKFSLEIQPFKTNSSGA